jgi:hypothetical protein
MHITVNTRDFENSHRRKPRGEGTWAFRLSGGAYGQQLFWATGKYSAAKGQAVAEAKKSLYDTVEVLS